MVVGQFERRHIRDARWRSKLFGMDIARLFVDHCGSLLEATVTNPSEPQKTSSMDSPEVKRLWNSWQRSIIVRNCTRPVLANVKVNCLVGPVEAQIDEIPRVQRRQRGIAGLEHGVVRRHVVLRNVSLGTSSLKAGLTYIRPFAVDQVCDACIFGIVLIAHVHLNTGGRVVYQGEGESCVISMIFSGRVAIALEFAYRNHRSMDAQSASLL